MRSERCGGRDETVHADAVGVRTDIGAEYEIALLEPGQVGGDRGSAVAGEA